jgi:predicted site-specific integrase-resolvase
MSNDIMDIKTAAKELGIAVTTLRQHCQEGYLGQKLGRDWIITRSDLEAFKRNRRNPGRPPKR